MEKRIDLDHCAECQCLEGCSRCRRRIGDLCLAPRHPGCTVDDCRRARAMAQARTESRYASLGEVAGESTGEADSESTGR